jgi:opacity protein-like surface antigen
MTRSAITSIKPRGNTGFAALALASAGWLIALGCATHVSAADVAPPSPPPTMQAVPTWTFAASSYLWATGLKGDLRTLPPLPRVSVDLSFGDVLKNLDGALMTSLEARHGRFILFGDLLLSRVSTERDFTVAGVAGSVGLKSLSFSGMGTVGYRIVDDPNISVDLLGGARVWTVKNTLSLQAAGIGIDYGKTESWVDGVAGGRIKIKLTDALFVSAIGLVGGLSSKLEWDVYGGLGYALDERWNLFAGYRALRVDYHRGNFIYRVTQQGPIMGATYKF